MSIILPHPSEVSLEVFLELLYQKLETDPSSIAASQINGVATDTELASHAAETSDIHGVSGQVVGDTDQQTLTNKIIDGATIKNSTLDAKTITGLSSAFAQLTDVTTIAGSGSLVGGFELDDLGFGVRVYQVGAWNMDSSTSPSAIAHGLGSDLDTRTVLIAASIVNDAESITRMLHTDNTAGSRASVSDGNITAQRATSGDFDNTSFNDSSMNRGHYILIYTLS